VRNPATKPVTIEYVEENGRHYAVRNGRRIEIESLSTEDLPKPKREAFEPKFAKLHFHWAEALEQAKNINTYRLAHRILFEEFRCERIGGEIILSSEMTRMSHTNRYRAAMELEELGLIKLLREGKHALRVIIL
jgi:hypothetical protein